MIRAAWILYDAAVHNVLRTAVYGYILIFIECSVRRCFENEILSGQITQGEVCKDKCQTVSGICALLPYMCIGGLSAAV